MKRFVAAGFTAGCPLCYHCRRLGAAIRTIPAKLTTITRRSFVGNISAAKATQQRYSGVRLQVSKD